MLCSECNKNLAVIFMTKIESGKQKTEGLCFECAKKRGIDPLNNMLLQSGMTEEELESLMNWSVDLVPLHNNMSESFVKELEKEAIYV